MTANLDQDTDGGRPIQLIPVAPGVWRVVLGTGVTVLAPLIGFLIGSILGTDAKTFGLNSIFFFLFLGFAIAGAGLGTALFGVQRVLRDRKRAAV